jgi:peptidoglycan/LPS O-acetylase OafA/YrhL
VWGDFDTGFAMLGLLLFVFLSTAACASARADILEVEETFFQSLNDYLDKLRAGDSDLVSTEISDQCVRALENVSKDERSVMFDAWGKPGAGIKEGNVYFYGSYDECGTLPNVNYCLASLTVESSTGAPFSIASLAVCIPNKCIESDVEFVFGHVLDALSVPFNLTAKCPPLEQHFSTGAIVVLVFLCFLGIFVLMASLFDALIQYNKQVRSVSAKEKTLNNRPYFKENGNSEGSPLLSKHTTTTPGRRKGWPQKLVIFLKDSFLAFSLYKTLPAILSTSQPPSAINCINGIRVLSMFWVIGSHVNLWFFSSFMLDNLGEVIAHVATQFSYQGILNGFFSVDSFFFLSGLLVSYLTMREMSRRAAKGAKMAGVFPFVTYYLHRFLRLTPTYAVVLAIVSQLLPSLGNGPVFSEAADSMTNSCNKYWWTNLLYINNFYPSLLESCAGWTWYLANDMQFYIISPIMLIPLYFSGPVGLVITGIILVGSLIVTGILAGVYNIGVSSLSALLQPSVTVGDYGSIYYVKPYCRIAPYIVGIVVGYMIYKGVKLPFKRIVNTIVYNGLMAFALGLIVAVVYGIYGLANGHLYSIAEVVSYTTLSRLTWGIALSFIVLACHHKYGWWVDKILSWPFWIPLSRLTFLAYLIHPIVLYLVITALRSPAHYSNVTVAVYMVGCTVLAYAMAGLLAVLVEFPFSNIEAAAFKLVGSRSRERKEEPHQKEPVENT